jgi:hypothetical protein
MKLLWVKKMKDYLRILLGKSVCALLCADLPYDAWGSMANDGISPCLV